MVCLAPWAYGSVEAWAELGLYAGYRTAHRSCQLSSCHLERTWPFGLPTQPGTRRGWCYWLFSRRCRSSMKFLHGSPRHWPRIGAQLVPAPAGACARRQRCRGRVAGDNTESGARFHASNGRPANRGLAAVSSRVGPERHSGRLTAIRSASWSSMRLCLRSFAIVQGLTWNGRIYWVRPAHASMNSWSVGGPFLSHSHLAAYLNMGLGLALGLLLQGNWRDFLRRDSRTMDRLRRGDHRRGSDRLAFAQRVPGFAGGQCLPCLFFSQTVDAPGFGLAVVLAIFGLCLALLGGSSPFGSRLATHPRRGQRGLPDSTGRYGGERSAAWWARPFWGSGFGVFPVAIIPYLKHSKPSILRQSRK